LAYYPKMSILLSDERIRAFEADPLAVLGPLGGGVIRLGAGQTILQQGQPVDHLYCLLAGTVKVEACDWEDRTLLVCFSRPPTFFGDVEVFWDGWSATCTLTGVSDLVLWRIDRNRLRRLWAEEPWVAGLIGRGLAGKVAARARESARNQLCPLAVRYEAYLREMGGGGVPVPIRLAETASLLATSPRHLQRVIADLVAGGQVERRGRSLVVKEA